MSNSSNTGLGGQTALSDSAAIPENCQRLPSSRPIDHRWDKSRGIIFCSPRQSVDRRPSTWAPQDDIKFASVPSRAYAMRSFDRGPRPPPPSPRSSTLPSLTDVQPKPSLPKADRLVNEINHLRKQLEEAMKNIKRVESANSNLLKSVHTGKEDLIRMDKSYDEKLAEREAKFTLALEEERLTLSRLVEERTVAERNKTREAQAKSLEAQQDRRNAELAAQRIQQELEDLHHLPVEAEELKRTAEQKFREAEKLRTTLQKTHEKALKSDRKALEQEFTQKDVELNRLFAKKQLDIRQRRMERKDYRAYRDYYLLVSNSIRAMKTPAWDLNAQYRSAASYLQHHGDMGAELKRRCNGKIKRHHADLLSRADKFVFVTKKTVQAGFEALNLAMDSLLSNLSDLGVHGHNSRYLTRRLRFDRLSDSVITDGWYRQMNVRPFQDHITKIDAALDGRAPMPMKGSHLMTQRLLCRDMIGLHSSIADCVSLRRVLRGSLADRFEFAMTLQARKTIRKAGDIMTDRRLNPVGMSEHNRDSLFEAYRINRSQSAIALETIGSVVRKRVLLGHDMGHIDDAEIQANDNLIKAELEILEQKVHKAIEALIQVKQRGAITKIRDDFRSRTRRMRMRASMAPLVPAFSGPKKKAMVRKTFGPVMTFRPTIPKRAQHIFWPEARNHVAESNEIESTKSGTRTEATPWSSLPVTSEEQITKRRSHVTGSDENESIIEPSYGAGIEAYAEDEVTSNYMSSERDSRVIFPELCIDNMPSSNYRASIEAHAKEEVTSNYMSSGPDIPKSNYGASIEAHAKEEVTSNHMSPEPDITNSNYGAGIEVHAKEEVTSNYMSSERDSRTISPALWNGDIPDSTVLATTSQMIEGDGSTTPSSVTVKDKDMAVSPTTSDGLQFQIPAAALRIATLASEGSDSSFWSHKLYQNDKGEKPKVYYCTKFDVAEKRAQDFLSEPVIGFDIEWEIGSSISKGGAKRNVSLIQIATEDKIALFHVALFKGNATEELMPPSLRRILESDKIVKAGVNIQGDAKRLKIFLDAEMKGLLELSHLYKVVLFSTGPEKVNRVPVNMAKQVQDIFALPLKKGEVRVSAWSRKLDHAQTEYAGADAYAGFRLYHALEAKRGRMDPMPPRPAFYEAFAPLILGDGTSIPHSKTRPTSKKAVKTQTATERVDEEIDDEFYDAVEQLDSTDSQTSTVAGVPLAGLNVSYPDLPALEGPL